jgi:hypothetical protein
MLEPEQLFDLRKHELKHLKLSTEGFPAQRRFAQAERISVSA